MGLREEVNRLMSEEKEQMSLTYPNVRQKRDELKERVNNLKSQIEGNNNKNSLKAIENELENIKIEADNIFREFLKDQNKICDRYDEKIQQIIDKSKFTPANILDIKDMSKYEVIKDLVSTASLDELRKMKEDLLYGGFQNKDTLALFNLALRNRYIKGDEKEKTQIRWIEENDKIIISNNRYNKNELHIAPSTCFSKEQFFENIGLVDFYLFNHDDSNVYFK